MKNNKKLFCTIQFLLFIMLFSCKNEAKLKVKNVTILGNSIVKHKPLAEIGWNGDYGMAATCVDSDFVHILTSQIHEFDTTVKVKFKNIADFETNYVGYEFSKLDSLSNSDMLILRISENVSDDTLREDFMVQYNKLIQYICSQKKTKVIIVGGYWPRKVNSLIKDYAKDHRFEYVDNSEFYSDSSNSAFGQFKHEGIQMHPSNKGMKKIANSIWKVIKDDFE